MDNNGNVLSPDILVGKGHFPVFKSISSFDFNSKGLFIFNSENIATATRTQCSINLIALLHQICTDNQFTDCTYGTSADTILFESTMSKNSLIRGETFVITKSFIPWNSDENFVTSGANSVHNPHYTGMLTTLQASSNVPALIDYYSAKYALTPAQHKMMYDTVKCESNFVVDTQSFSINSKGIRENSWGLAQIHLPSHPTISRQQAINPDFALNFIAYHFSKEHYSMWSCMKLLGYLPLNGG